MVRALCIQLAPASVPKAGAAAVNRASEALWRQAREACPSPSMSVGAAEACALSPSVGLNARAPSASPALGSRGMGTTELRLTSNMSSRSLLQLEGGEGSVNSLTRAFVVCYASHKNPVIWFLAHERAHGSRFTVQASGAHCEMLGVGPRLRQSPWADHAPPA